jgi:hypothetical protein
MKTKVIIVALLTFLMLGCASNHRLVKKQNYLPKYDEIQLNPYGSMIWINLSGSKFILGELIAIQDNDIILLADSTTFGNRINVVPLSTVSNFYVRIAQASNYSASILLLPLTLSHGGFLIFSLPVNIFSSLALINSGNRDYLYFSGKNIDIEGAKAFARFPAGIPEGINIEDIK